MPVQPFHVVDGNHVARVGEYPHVAETGDGNAAEPQLDHHADPPVAAGSANAGVSRVTVAPHS